MLAATPTVTQIRLARWEWASLMPTTKIWLATVTPASRKQ